MKPARPAFRRAAMRFTVFLAACGVLVGVVMAETHVPVPLAPDAPRADDAQVATFALG